MQRVFWLILAPAITLILAACHGPMGHGMHHHPGCASCCKLSGTKVTPAEAGARGDVLYACDCGSSCDCTSFSMVPGNCACGKPLRWHHVIKIDNDEALLCSCMEGCACSLDPADPTKCSCGNRVNRVSLKGSGLFFCNCGGSCVCNTVKAGPGKCRCGMQLRQMN